MCQQFIKKDIIVHTSECRSREILHNDKRPEPPTDERSSSPPNRPSHLQFELPKEPDWILNSLGEISSRVEQQPSRTNLSIPPTCRQCFSYCRYLSFLSDLPSFHRRVTWNSAENEHHGREIYLGSRIITYAHRSLDFGRNGTHYSLEFEKYLDK
ncbi:hypothetical protein T265_05152 [Opisthorchis viverrini]|uniref:Uncharacterized protein n=1 Tax=Opisthorchis viverrini TaxID=6198 RepID=A0A074ZKK7_OPIVI|nr:hypothetical protein T265_05152 [Opisthorchis viverrini]KER27863.1 hypothetical protein T265_05152 [Opisthorchis viverrini]